MRRHKETQKISNFLNKRRPNATFKEKFIENPTEISYHVKLMSSF